MIFEKICLFKTHDKLFSLISYQVTCINEFWIYLIISFSFIGIVFIIYYSYMLCKFIEDY